VTQVGHLIKDIFQNPFDYAIGAVMFILCVGVVVRFGKQVWNQIVNDED